MNSATFFWHDYETWGIHPAQDRPAQFAGVRTDAQLNVIGKPVLLYCSPTPDYLPSVEACLVTGITPQEALEKGMSEAAFIARIHAEMAQPNTCTVGYNSIRFDDEFTRNILFRNFYDPYAREWQNGNSRWDLIDVARLCYALRPEGVQWPVREDGAVSFKLEELTAANDIEHEGAHDALSDVYATIEFARLLRKAQPKLFEYALGLRHKNTVQKLLDVHKQVPVVHVSGRVHASRHCAGFVMPLLSHPSNKNSVIVFDLYQDPSELLRLSAEEIRTLMFTRTEDLPEGVERPAVREVRVNRSPMVAPASVVDEHTAERLGWDLALFRERWRMLRNDPHLRGKLLEVFSQSPFAEGGDENLDPELSLYSGPFFSPQDQQLRRQVTQTDGPSLATLQLPFEDDRLPELLWRYRCRNFPQTLSAQEKEDWYAFCRAQLTHPEGRNISGLRRELAQRSLAANSAEERHLYSELIDYINSVAKEVGLA